MVSRVAMLSLHSSPLDQPGTGSSGGMNVYVRELSRALACIDIAVDIFTRSTGELNVIEDGSGVRVVAIPAGPRGPIAKAALADLAPALLAGIDGFARDEHLTYDVVHSHYWSSGLVAQHLARRWHVPMVHMFHTLSRAKARFAGTAEDTRRTRAEQRLLDSADALVVSNAIERAQIVELYGAPRAQLVTIPCGVDPTLFSGEHSATTDDSFRVIALGRVERLKNFDLLLNAVAIACAREPRFAQAIEVRIVGGPAGDEPETLPALERQARELGIETQVRFLGAIAHDRIPALYTSSDCCVVPSWHESFGLVALEAMAGGLPVIATRTGGLQVTVVDGVTGYLVAPDDPAVLADRLIELWSSPAQRAEFGARGMRAAQHYAWPIVAERMRCLYSSLMAGSEEIAR